ncbi:helix-turn-helix domain-containing protein, partial [Dyadobacter sp.]|uniref:helix-turn-helix domain-containing protein n=1 Tax=Dyadobacter sp. TaxID=1914288 RepID=UPI003F727A2D
QLEIMSIQLYSHAKGDLEKAVEIVLQKANSLLLVKEKKTPEEIDQLIPQAEAAKVLQRSVATVIDWRKNKGLPHYNFNGRYLYSKAELLEYGRKQAQKKA